MRNRRNGELVARLVEAARYEVLPTPSAEDSVLAHLPRERMVTVTASPAKGLAATLDLAERLAGHGYPVVPHLAARMVHAGGDAELDGTYPDALSLLEDLAELGRPFSHVGITGYPESHPTITDDLTVQSMWDKRRYATHVVSNLTFDPATIRVWVKRMRDRGITMPLLLGVPGPVERTKLLAMATKIGVGESTRFLVKHKGTLARLAAPGGFTGEKFLEQCAPALAVPGAAVEGIHVFTFNQIAETEAWRNDLLRRLRA